MSWDTVVMTSFFSAFFLPKSRICSCTVVITDAWFPIIWVCRCTVVSQFSTVHYGKISATAYLFVQLCIEMHSSIVRTLYMLLTHTINSPLLQYKTDCDVTQCLQGVCGVCGMTPCWGLVNSTGQLGTLPQFSTIIKRYRYSKCGLASFKKTCGLYQIDHVMLCVHEHLRFQNVSTFPHFKNATIQHIK